MKRKDVWETTHTKTYTFALAAAKNKESTLLLHEAKATPDAPRPKARVTLDDQRDKFLELKELTKKPDGTRLGSLSCATRRGTGGDLSASDMKANGDALKEETRLLSAYHLKDGTKIWISTETADDEGHRAATTALLPSEY